MRLSGERMGRSGERMGRSEERMGRSGEGEWGGVEKENGEEWRRMRRVKEENGEE